MKIIERDYLTRLIDLVGTPDIKVITGIRRCGKSKLLEMLNAYLISKIDNSNVIQIDLTRMDFEDLLDYHRLYKYIKEKHKSDRLNFLLIDEVQMCEHFEKVINSLYSEGGFEMFLSGSNAFLLSSDLATLFTGRTMEVEIYPFSYKEYQKYYEILDSRNSFDNYAFEGSMPGSYGYVKIEDKLEYISNVYETIIQRDLIKRKKIRNEVLLKKISDFLMDNISNITSIKNITENLNNNTMPINDKTVGSYIESLCQAFLFYKVKRYDIKGKKYLASSEKYYLNDPSFKYAILGVKDMNYGRIYENIVAIELLRRGYEIYVGMLYKKEIDFVAIKRNEKIYIQVSDDISNENTFKREVDSLLKIADAYPKILIARIRHPQYTYEGIKIIDIGEWLSENNN